MGEEGNSAKGEEVLEVRGDKTRGSERKRGGREERAV